jgi:hypothetical protein
LFRRTLRGSSYVRHCLIDLVPSEWPETFSAPRGITVDQEHRRKRTKFFRRILESRLLAGPDLVFQLYANALVLISDKAA